MLAKLTIALTSGAGKIAGRIVAAGRDALHATAFRQTAPVLSTLRLSSSRRVAISVLAVAFLTLLSYPAHPAAARSYPMLFGSYELQSSNMQKFPKWNSMLARWKNGAPCESSTCTTKGWKELIARLQGKDLATQLKEVNREMNLHPYILDINNWGAEDYWATPFEFLKKNGDCEDFAISKYMALKALGVPIDDMRIVALRDLNLQLGHAVLVVYVNNQPMLLDNQIGSVVPANSIKHYQPVYSINEHNWWLHTR